MGNTVLHATGDHGVSCRLIYEGKQQTGNEKDPSAALGMTKRGNASRPFLFDSHRGSQPPALRATSFQRKAGEEVKTHLPPSCGRGMPEGQGVGRREKERSQPPPLRLTPCGGRRENAAFPHRHFERKREIFFVRGQISAVRKADHGKHRSPYDFIPLRKSTSASSLPHTKAFSTRKSL